MKIIPLALAMALSAFSQTVSASACTIYINAVTNEHNVGIYECDMDGVCLLQSSYLDPEADLTPLQADEEVIDLGQANTNSGPTQSDKLPNGALNNCDDPGNGNGGSSGGPILPPVVATAPRPRERVVAIRTFYRSGGTGNVGGGLGNSSTRAAREVKKVNVAAICGAEYPVRSAAAANAIAAANPGRPAPGMIFTGTTEDGFDERWMVASVMFSDVRVGLLETNCPNGGGN